MGNPVHKGVFMDLLVQNLKQEQVLAFQELAHSLGVDVVVLPPKNKRTGKVSSSLLIDSLSKEPVEVNMSRSKSSTPLTHLHKKEAISYYRQSYLCNSYHNPLNTHKKDHCAPISDGGSARHPHKSRQRHTDDPHSGFGFDI